jgi:HPt (histidine-containing phosphotransfer) domain-containing protein
MKELKFLQEKGIDTDSAIEILGDIDMYNDTLADFLTECDTRLPNIEKYKDSNDMENYAILVHALKGDSKYLGFTKLAELSYNHQIESQNGNIDYINSHYNELIEETKRIIDIVKEYLG